MSPRNILITGCNRGIGLELVKQFLKDGNNKPANLFATCRDPAKAEELTALAKDNPGVVHILKLEVTDHSQFAGVAEQVSAKVGDAGLNLLINNAGVLPPERQNGLDAEMMRNAYEVNCIAPIFFTKALLPLVEKAKAAKGDGGMSADAAVIMMSTAVASVAENTGGGIFAYRCSKTALNMAMKSFSVELKDKGVLIMSMHPGWVRTDMGGPKGLIDTEECASVMVKTIDQLADKDHGAFLRYNNTPIPW